VHYWADLQSVHGFRCYDNIAQTRNVSDWLVLAVCLVIVRNHMLNFFTQDWYGKRSYMQQQWSR